MCNDANFLIMQVTEVRMANYVPTIWEVIEAKSTRQVNTYEGITSIWPAIVVDFKIRRKSFVDRKVAVLPLIRK